MAHLQELFSKPLYGPNVMGDALLPIQDDHGEGDAMQPLGWVEFTDGIKRPLFEMHGKQYVEVEGQPVFGVWLVDRADWESTLPHRDEADRPIVVEREP